jgi:hypothetical protein
VLGNRVLDLDTDQRGAERGLDRASEPDALAVLRLTPGNSRGRRLASEELSHAAEEHVRIGLCKSEWISTQVGKDHIS